MAPREIPGFYYDAANKKYFRIQANHTSPANSKYSLEAVEKARKEEQRHAIEIARTAQIKTQLLKRSRVLRNSSVAGVGVEREVRDSRSCGMRERVRAYVGAFEEVWRRTWSSEATLEAFVVDRETASLIAGYKDPDGHHGLCATRFNSNRKELDQFSGLHTNDITSVSITPSRNVMMTTMGGANPANISIFSLMDPALQPKLNLPASYDVAVGFTRRDQTDVWTSAANPFLVTTSTFAVALTDKVIIYTNAQNHWDDTRSLPTNTDALALDWLSPTLLSIGQRDGLVKLWDQRSGGSAMRLQHPGLVNSIRHIGSKHLIVCGLQDALAMYDLRMPALKHLGHNRPPAAKRRRWDRAVPLIERPSQAVIRYDFESGLQRRGFDVSGDVLAAVDANNVVQLYGAQSGEKIKNLRANRVNVEGAMPASCLQFVEGFMEGDGREELVGCCDKDFVSWSW